MLRTLAVFASTATLLVACATPRAAEPAPAATSAEACAEPESTLRLEGTPEIPAELRARLTQYLNTRRGVFGDISADGRSVLVSTRFAQTRQLHLLRRPLGARSQLTFRDEPVRAPRFVPGDDGVLTFVSDRGGDETYQIFRLDLDSGLTTLVSDGKSRHESYLWSADGRQLAFNNNSRNGRDMDIYLGDGRDPASVRRLLEVQGHWYPIDWSPDGTQLLLGEYVSINDSRLHLVEVASGKVRRISPPEPVAAYREARFGPAGKTLYLTSDREGEFVELYALDLASGSFRSLSRDLPWNIEELALAADGKTLAFTANEDGYSALYLLDLASGKRQPVAEASGGLIFGLRFASKAPVLGFTRMGPTETGDTYSFDLRTRMLARWTQSEIGGLDPAGFVSPELVRYRTFDDREIPAFYYRPAGDGPHPVLVSIHGGPEGQARPYFHALTQYLVREKGVAVLVPNVRGSDGYGKSYLLMDNGFKREDSVKDIGALLDWVGQRPELDASRMAVLGGSYGGYMVLASLVHFGERLRAGVDVVGISNFVTFLENTKAYRRDLRRAEYGDERDPAMRKHLQAISPSNHADQIRSALFVAHGANDPRVPLSETDQIVARVRDQGQDAWYMVATNEGHGFRKKDNVDTYYLLTVLFLTQHLGL